MPRWLVMENVTGITSIAGGAIVRQIFDEIEALGYRVEMRVLKAEEYGVPQERRRVFFIATRTDAPILFPEPTHGSGLQPFVTVWDAISDLPVVHNGDTPPVRAYASQPKNGYQAILRGDCRMLFNHAPGRLARVNEERMKRLAVRGGIFLVSYFQLGC